MSNLPLSDAILLGSLTISEPKAYDTETCAIAMALAAVGDAPDRDNFMLPRVDGRSDYSDEDGEGVRDNPLTLRTKDVISGDSGFLAEWHIRLLQNYEWLQDIRTSCPWCNAAIRSTELVHHPFDEHVMTGQIALDSLATWIAALEPSPPPPPKILDIGAGMRFGTEREWCDAQRLASELGLSLNAYMTAAVRLTLQNPELLLSTAIRRSLFPSISDEHGGPGVSVYFQTAEEKAAVLRAAWDSDLNRWGYISAAVRLVTTNGLDVKPFVREDRQLMGTIVLYGPFPDAFHRSRRAEFSQQLAHMRS